MPRTRGIALWEDRVLANLPDGRVIAINRDNGEIVWDKKIATKNEFGGQEKFFTAPLVADGKVLIQNGAGDGGTRGWVAALDVKTGDELWRFYVVPKPGDPGQRDVEGRSQRLEDRRRRHLADRLLRSGHEALHRRHRQPVSDLRPAVPSGRQPVHQLGHRAQRRHRQARLALPVHAERLVGLTTKSASTCCTTSRSTAQKRKVVGHYARNGFYYTLDRTNGKFIKAEKYVNDLNWTKGIDPEDRQAARVQPEARRADLQPRGARAARRRQEAHLPDLARRHRAPAAGVQPDQEHRLRRRHRRLLHAERRGGGVARARTAASTTKAERAADSTAAICTTAR